MAAVASPRRLPAVLAVLAVLGVTPQSPATAASGAVVAGVVTDATGAPISGAVVTDPAAQGASGVTTAVDGSYRLTLPVGSHTLTATAGGSVGSYLTSTPSGASTDKFSVADGQVMAADIGIGPRDAPAIVTGVVTGPGGGPVANVIVEAVPSEAAAAATASVATDSAGAYTITVPPGSYQLHVEPATTDYQAIWWPSSQARAGSASLRIRAGQTWSGLDATLAPLVPLASTPSPKIDGPTTVGYTLTAAPGAWGPAPVALSYQWYRSSTPIAGATASTYLSTDGDVGHAVSVSVTGVKPGYVSTTRTSAAVTIAQLGSSLGPGQQVSGSTVLTTGQYRVGVAQGLSETDNNGRLLWQGSPAAAGRLIMQTDGNLVYYSTAGTAIWQSGTSGNPGATAALTPDGSLAVLSAAGKTLWSNGAYDDRLSSSQAAGVSASLQPGYVLYSPNRAVRLVMQSDGNLVLYKVSTNTALWQSGTGSNPGAYLTLQTDGNAVIYAGSSAKWTSGTGSSTAGVRQLVLQTDGNLVLYSATNTALWQTATRL